MARAPLSLALACLLGLAGQAAAANGKPAAEKPAAEKPAAEKPAAETPAETDPKSWTKLMSAAERARDLGKFEDAKRELEAARAGNPEGIASVITDTQLSEAHLLLDEHEKAREAAKRALGFKQQLDALPQLRGQILETLAHAMAKTGGDKKAIDEAIATATKIRQERNSPFTPRAEDYSLRHDPSGFRYPLDLGPLRRVSLKRASKDAPHVTGKYVRWLDDSAMFADVIVYPGDRKALRPAFDRFRAVIHHHYKDAERLAKGDYPLAETAHGAKGLTAQWIFTGDKAESGTAYRVWQGIYFLQRGDTIVQIRSRAAADKAEQAAKMSDALVEALQWPRRAD